MSILFELLVIQPITKSEIKKKWIIKKYWKVLNINYNHQNSDLNLIHM